MATSQPPDWKWDVVRQQWYFHHAAENCFVYESGQKLRPDGTPVASIPRSTEVSRDIRSTRGESDVSTSENAYTVRPIGGSAASPAVIPTVSSSMTGTTPTSSTRTQIYPASYTYTTVDSTRSAGQGYPSTQYNSAVPTSRAQSGSIDYASTTTDLSTMRYSSGINPSYQLRAGWSDQSSTGLYTSTPQHPSTPGTTHQPNYVGSQWPPHQEGPKEPTVIKGTRGKKERLNENFRVREPGSQFFRPGVVFKILWSEPASNRIPQDSSYATDREPVDPRYIGGRYDQTIFTEFRWFVVVREGNNHCTCLRVQTFNQRGVTSNKVKSHYAIIYTGPTAPQPEPAEIARAGEDPMGAPIRVKPNRPYDKMHQLSRINFFKPYTVEHSVKVYDFGRVDESDEWKLISQWKKAWGIEDPRPPGPRGGASAQSGASAGVSGMTANFQSLGLQSSSIPGTGYSGYSQYHSGTVPSGYDDPRRSSYTTATTSSGSYDYSASRPTEMPRSYGNQETVHSETTETTETGASGEETEVPEDYELYEGPRHHESRRRRRKR